MKIQFQSGIDRIDAAAFPNWKRVGLIME